VFYLDLDNFKPVNDDFGHDAGDQILIAVGERLTSNTRSTDTVARLGGDEFAVLIAAQTSRQETDLLADRLAHTFARPFAIAHHTLTLGASIGRAVFPTDADSAESLLRVADAAVFQAKRSRYQTAPQPARRR
jgi:diguanylate cyclase (GGDEF)-like protein